MPESPTALRLVIGLEPDAEAAELDAATSQLRRELLLLDVDSVERPPGPDPPPGARGIELALLGTVVVGAGRAALGTVVGTVQAWVGRMSSRSVKITLDGDTIELTNASSDDQRRLVESFLARHGTDPP